MEEKFFKKKEGYRLVLKHYDDGTLVKFVKTKPSLILNEQEHLERGKERFPEYYNKVTTATMLMSKLMKVAVNYDRDMFEYYKDNEVEPEFSDPNYYYITVEKNTLKIKKAFYHSKTQGSFLRFSWKQAAIDVLDRYFYEICVVYRDLFGYDDVKYEKSEIWL